MSSNSYVPEDKLAKSEAFALGDEDSERHGHMGSRSEKALLRKIDFRLVPIIALLYLMSFLDRINISNALTLGLQKRLHLQGNEVNVALCIFYVPYILFEIPSNLLLRKLKPHVWLSGCLVAFGIVLLCHGFVENYSGLLAVRFFLGFAEAGVLPGCSYLLSMWYKPEEALRRFAIFFNSVTLAGAFGSLLATGINYMDGTQGKAGWQWIFILEGVVTVGIGLGAFFVIPNFPEETKWLNPSERQFMRDRMKVAEGESSDGLPLKTSLARYFSDYKSWVVGFLYFGGNIVGYSVSYFLPTIIKGFHYSSIQTQLHAVPPFAAAWGFSISLCFLSAWVRHRIGFIVFSLAIAISGAGILLHGEHNYHVAYAATFLITMGLFGGLPIAIMWYVMNLEGHTQRALGSGFMIAFGNIGGFVATFSFQASDAPGYHTGYSLIMFGLVLCLSCAIGYGVGLYLESRRAGPGQSRKIVF